MTSSEIILRIRPKISFQIVSHLRMLSTMLQKKRNESCRPAYSECAASGCALHLAPLVPYKHPAAYRARVNTRTLNVCKLMGYCVGQRVRIVGLRWLKASAPLKAAEVALG
jgi:hypothetical protein